MSLDLFGLNRYEHEWRRQRQIAASQDASLKTLSDARTKYADKFQEDTNEAQKERNEVTMSGSDKGMVQDYYAFATDFYEYGWGSSFHFGIMWKDSSLEDAVKRYEYYLPLRMKVGPGDRLLDLGCGVGGPMRNITRFTDANVVGVNISDYQVFRANLLSEQAGLSGKCQAQVGDFMELDFEENTFDGVYAIEATCHTNDKVAVYSEAFRVLKPGAYFAGWEWVTTDAYDPKNEEHRRIRFGIEMGNGLPETVHWKKVIEALKEAGFEVVDYFDGADRCEVPWYTSLTKAFSLSGIAHTWLGAKTTTLLCSTLETLRILPKGVTEAHKLLLRGADNLVLGGKIGICKD